ncbi:MAG: SurA N-terminal domain-containing protein [Desulfobacteraceae bacterium]|nr:SurA N-terminal domain-containing protein [Desulfobacteraceae bacterium]
MNRFILIFLAAGAVFSLYSCADSGEGGSKPVARVNDYVITMDNFRRELARSAYFHDMVGLSLADKKRILDEEIRKELLIQEAVKLGIDKDADFRKTIERYWEQTLIASLIRRQGDSIRSGIIVTEDEIESRLREKRPQGAALPAAGDLKQDLEKEIRDEKQTKALEAWAEELWKKATIRVNEENLGSLK